MSKPVSGKLDTGIAYAVEVLQAGGIETYESCEGGYGHAYPEPTVAFLGGPGEGWRALAICLSYGLSPAELRRTWDILDGEPTGPHWQVIFRRKVAKP